MSTEAASSNAVNFAMGTLLTPLQGLGGHRLCRCLYDSIKHEHLFYTMKRLFSGAANKCIPYFQM